MLYDEMLTLTTAQLQQYRANSKATCSCLGHSKGEQNENLVRLYTEVLESRNVKPDDSIEGSFNGEGSY